MIENLTNTPIRLNSPRSSSIAKLTMIDKKGNEAMPPQLIHRLGAGSNDFIYLAPNDSAVVNYFKPLGELFEVIKNRRYTVQLRYVGILWQDNKKVNYKRTFYDT